MADSDWTTLRLGEVCSKIGSGATPRGGGDVYLNSGPLPREGMTNGIP